MSQSLLEFLGEPNPSKPAEGQRVELVRGLSIRQNVRNPFLVLTLRYEADPSKDPLTPEGKRWYSQRLRDQGCYRICRYCDRACEVRDEECPECGSETDLILSNKWRREYEIDYSAHSGSYIFDSFTKSRNTCKPFRVPAGWSRWRLIDHGLRNPTAVLWIAVDEDRNAWCYAEHYEAGQGVDHHARQIHQMSALLDYHALEMTASDLRWMELNDWKPTPDFLKKSTKLYRTVGDPSMGNKTQKEVKTIKHRYIDNGVVIQDANRASAGYETLNTMFGKGSFTIFETCENTIREVSSIVWAEHHDPALNKKERAVDRDDHTVDCCRYFANAFAPPTKESEKPSAGEYGLEEGLAAERVTAQKRREVLKRRRRGDHILDI